jgi:hypothetical protein
VHCDPLFFFLFFFILQCRSFILLFILITLHVSFPCPLYMLLLLYFLLGAKYKSS